MVPIIEPEVNIKSAERDASRPHPARRDPRRARRDSRTASRSCSSCRSRPRPGLFAAAGRSSQGAARGRSVGRLLPRRSLPRAGQEPRHDRQLQPGACCPTFAHRQSDEEFDRTLGDGDRRDLRSVDREGRRLALGGSRNGTRRRTDQRLATARADVGVAVDRRRSRLAGHSRAVNAAVEGSPSAAPRASART